MFKKMILINFVMIQVLIAQDDRYFVPVKQTKSSNLRKKTFQDKFNKKLKPSENSSLLSSISSVGSVNSENDSKGSASDFDLKNDSGFESRPTTWNQDFNEKSKSEIFKVQKRKSLKRFMTENEEDLAQKRLQALQRKNNKWKELPSDEPKKAAPVISDEDLESDFSDHAW